MVLHTYNECVRRVTKLFILQTTSVIVSAATSTPSFAFLYTKWPKDSGHFRFQTFSRLSREILKLQKYIKHVKPHMFQRRFGHEDKQETNSKLNIQRFPILGKGIDYKDSIQKLLGTLRWFFLVGQRRKNWTCFADKFATLKKIGSSLMITKLASALADF